MKRLLILPLLLLSLTLGATKYYIATTGNNGNDGSSGSPWATLAYACTQATTAGDTIYVNAGTYTETAQSALSVGVYIHGAGATSIITTNVALSPIIYLSSVSEGTNGNQTISYIQVDGDSTATSLIYVSGRSNVKIHHCTFVDAATYGVVFRGKVNANSGAPTTYATGNEFHDNTMSMCGSYAAEGRGNLEFSGQQGLLIYNNDIEQGDRGGTTHGYGIKSVINNGFSRGVKIYNNTITVPPYEGSGFDFAIEIWNQWGMEIYDNTILGSVDMAGNFTAWQDTYDYALSIHDNTIGNAVLGQYELPTGIYLEGDCELTYIYGNHIYNVAAGIKINPVGSDSDLSYLGRREHWYNDVYIYYNILENIGVNASGSSSKGWGIYWLGDSYTHLVDNFNVLNNVIIGDTDATSTMWGIGLPCVGDATNVTIRNNIVCNFDYGPTLGYLGDVGDATVDTLSIENNCFYGNGNSNAPRYGASFTPTNNTTQNNITTAPAFKSQSTYRLSDASPCIDTGIDVNIDYDYYGHKITGTPDIGAMEYGRYTMKTANKTYR